jgi:hypothetical protein
VASANPIFVGIKNWVTKDPPLAPFIAKKKIITVNERRLGPTLPTMSNSPICALGKGKGP